MKYGFVRAGVCTPEIKVADVSFNVAGIKKALAEADKKGVEMLVFPELCLTGYTVGDLFYSDVLLNGAQNGLVEIAEFSKGIKTLIFVGLPFKKDGVIYNVAAAVCDGKILGLIPKTYIPNYNEFYEKRYFARAPRKNSVVEINGEQIVFGTNVIFSEKSERDFTVAVEICEDLWSISPPSERHSAAGASIIANLSCSDEVVGKAEYRRSLVASHSAKTVSGYVYADAGEGESTTDMVFAGHNLIAENGNILSESKLFLNGMIVADIDVGFLSFERSKLFNYDFENQTDYSVISFSANREENAMERFFTKTPFVPENNGELNDRASLILSMQAEGLKKRIKHTNARTLVIGLSGGLDSTLALLVSVSAMKKLGRDLKDVIAVTMPCFGTTSRTYQNTLKLAKALKVTLKKVDITKAVTVHLKDLKHPLDLFDVTFENSQARERTQVLMDIANSTGGMVVGTGDLSELALGWATYNGDHMSMYGVNSSVPKTLVRHVVNYYADNSKGKLKAVLKDILDTPVSPELLPPDGDDIAQKTEDIVGPYILHDFFLYCMIRKGYSPKKIYEAAKVTFKGEFSEQVVLKWLKVFTRRFFNQQFKRSCLPDGVKVGTVALSPRGDWRMPSDAVSTLWLEELEKI